MGTYLDSRLSLIALRASCCCYISISRGRDEEDCSHYCRQGSTKLAVVQAEMVRAYGIGSAMTPSASDRKRATILSCILTIGCIRTLVRVIRQGVVYLPSLIISDVGW